MAKSVQKAIVVSDVLKRVLMVPPTHFKIEYSINPWMGGVVNKAIAFQQWNTLKSEIEKEGVQVLTLNQIDGLPDMVFSCNSGLVFNNKIYLSKFCNLQREGEQKHFAKWFKNNNFELFGETYPVFFEGGGDAVFSDYSTLWGGYGFRTSKEAYENVKKLGDFKIILCELIDPKFYHIDTCFCPIGADSALWYPNAFSKASQNEILKHLPNAIEVSEAEASAFVCNSIAIRKKVISPIGVSQTTRKLLEHLGYTVVEINMSEFMKAGGACQCLVMKL